MSKRKQPTAIVLARCAIVTTAVTLLAIALLFVPYGYSAYITNTANSKTGIGKPEQRMHVPWRYATHRFIFADPPVDDPRRGLEAIAFRGDDWTATDVTDMAIGWHLVAVEVALILITAVAAFTSTILVDRRTSSAD